MSDESARRDRGTVFVGRSSELAALKAALALAAAGSGRVVMLVGEAGIGKTRTAAEFAAQVQAKDTLVLRGSCYEGEWAPVYGPFVDALTAYIRQTDPAQLHEELAFGGPPLSRLLPVLRERIPDVPKPIALQPDEERFRLFDAASQFLIAIARDRTVVLLLDDLHWADKDTIAMLRHIARFAPQHRILLLGTYRDVELEPQHPLTDALGALYRETTCERIALQGLDEHEVAQLVADSEAPPEMRDRLATTIRAATNGNPFFVREVLQHLIEESRLPRGPNHQAAADAMLPISIPDSVRQVLARRVRRLSAETGALLTVGAAFGGPFHLGVAAHVAGLDDTGALKALDEALRAQLVRPAGSVERYDFAHALIRETLYTELNPSRRVRLHRHLAEAMEAVHAERAGEYAAEIAEQYRRSRDLPGAERGVTYAVAAADRAEAMYAHDEVVRLLRIALVLTPQTAPRPARLLGRLAKALMWVLSFDEAVQAAHEAGELIAATEGAAAAAAYLGEATINLLQAGSAHSAAKVARQGMAYVGERRDLTWLRLVSCDVVRREQEDPEYPGIPLDGPERREMGAVVRSLSPEDLTGIPLCIPLASRGDALHVLPPQVSFTWTGDFRGSLAALEEGATRCEREGRINSAAICLTGVARCRLALGEIAAADEAHARAVAFCDRLPFSSVGPLVCAEYCVERCAAVDDGWAELFSMMVTLAGQPDPQNLYVLAAMQAGTAIILARLGQPEEALQMLAAVPAALDRAPAWAPQYTVLACSAATTLWCADRLDYAECVERNLRDKVIAADFRFPGDDGRLALAQLCALQRRYDEAVEWFARARAVLDEQGARPLRAITDYDEALMYARRGADGDGARAQPLLEAALAQFCNLGMSGWIRRAEHLLATGAEWSPATQPDTPQQQPAVFQQETRDQEPETCVFRCEGDVWAVTFAGATHRLKDTRGLHYLAQLFAHPRQEFHVNEIATLSAAPTSSARVERELPTAVDLGDAGELLDGEATAQYQRRLAEAREELEEAQANNDVGRHTRLREELEFLIAELASAGRGRRAASHAGRARSAVGKRLRAALKQIGAVDPALGRYLRATVRIGTFCSYTPDPRLRVECEV